MKGMRVAGVVAACIASAASAARGEGHLRQPGLNRGARNVELRHLEALDPPEGHVDGFVLSGVYYKGVGTAPREQPVVLRAAVAPREQEAQGRNLRETIPWETQRDKVRTMMKLSYVAYHSAMSFTKGDLDPVQAAGDLLMGETYAAEVEATTELHELLTTTFAAVRTISGKSAQEADDLVGVEALEWTRPGVGTVLVFRGEETYYEKLSSMIWVNDWGLEKMTQQMKSQWSSLEDLTWTDEMDSRADRNTIWADAAFRIKSYFQMHGLGPISGVGSLKEVWEDTTGLSTVVDQGFWPITKEVVMATIRGLDSGEKLFFTGHSQGGSRAALAAMWRENLDGTLHETVTFGALGGTCFARNLAMSDSTYLADVNPFVTHDQITEYVDAIDPVGFMGVDPGSQCVYGTENVTQRPAVEYCEKIFGFPGTTLLLAASGALGLKGLQSDIERCLYFTHNPVAMLINLMNDQVLATDGSTDGGCTTTPIDISDTDEQCPTGAVPSSFYYITATLICVLLFTLICILALLPAMFRKFVRIICCSNHKAQAKGKQQQQVSPAVSGLPGPIYRLEPVESNDKRRSRK